MMFSKNQIAIQFTLSRTYSLHAHCMEISFRQYIATFPTFNTRWHDLVLKWSQLSPHIWQKDFECCFSPQILDINGGALRSFWFCSS